MYKLACRVIENEKNEGDSGSRIARSNREITRALKAADEARRKAALQLNAGAVLLEAGPLAHQALPGGRAL